MYRCFKVRKFLFIFCCIVLIVTSIFFVDNFISVEAKMTSNPSEDKGVFVPIIMYHSVLKDQSRAGRFVVSPTTVESDMEYLKEHGYTAIFVKDLIDYVYNDVKLPDKPIILTFDDGFYNNETYVLPLLKEYNMKAVISVVGSYSEATFQTNDHNPSYAYLTWEDISELSKSGYVEIGNHTYNMHSNSSRKGCSIMSGESNDHYAKAIDDDILKLQNILTQKSGVTPVTFAYPFGYISKESVPLLKEIGIKATLTCYEKPNYITKNPDTLFGLNRYNRESGISTERFMKKVLAG